VESEKYSTNFEESSQAIFKLEEAIEAEKNQGKKVTENIENTYDTSQTNRRYTTLLQKEALKAEQFLTSRSQFLGEKKKPT
jgi:hypothetical protein